MLRNILPKRLARILESCIVGRTRKSSSTTKKTSDLRRNTMSGLCFPSVTYVRVRSHRESLVLRVLLATATFLNVGFASLLQRCAVATFGHLRSVNSLRLSSRALSCSQLQRFSLGSRVTYNAILCRRQIGVKGIISLRIFKAEP